MENWTAFASFNMKQGSSLRANMNTGSEYREFLNLRMVANTKENSMKGVSMAPG